MALRDDSRLHNTHVWVTMKGSNSALVMVTTQQAFAWVTTIKPTPEPNRDPAIHRFRHDADSFGQPGRQLATKCSQP